MTAIKIINQFSMPGKYYVEATQNYVNLKNFAKKSFVNFDPNAFRNCLFHLPQCHENSNVNCGHLSS